MEAGFGFDFGGISVHADEDATRLADALSARAYTVGSHIVFGRGEYAPQTDAGRRLLLHELAHAVQQRAADAAVSRVTLGEEQGAAEREAEHAAGRVGAGLALSAPLGQAPLQVQRKPKQKPEFKEGQQVELTLSGLNMAQGLGGTRQGNILAARLTRGDILELGKPHPQGGGEVFYATVVKAVAGKYTGRVGVVRTDWIKPATTPATKAAGKQPAPKTAPRKVYEPSDDLLEFDLDTEGPGITLTTPKKPAPKVTSVVEEYIKLVQATQPLNELLQKELGANPGDALAAAAWVYAMRREIIQAADGTGPLGIPPELLAAIVAMEMVNRGDSMAAEILVAQLFWLGDHSIGITQMKLSTAAMQQGILPWITAKSGSEDDRDTAGDKVESHFDALQDSVKEQLLETLADPAQALAVTAPYLARLKNRSNRFPALKAGQLADGLHGDLAAIIATEYHLGPTDTPRDKAKPDSYGNAVGMFASDARLKQVLRK